jgi:hypothetical protein
VTGADEAIAIAMAEAARLVRETADILDLVISILESDIVKLCEL